MSRDITPAAKTASKAEHIPYTLLVEMDFASGFVRVNSSSHGITWQGNVYKGLGTLGSVDPIVETSVIEAHGIKLSLSGIDPALIATALGENYQGRACRVWIALLDSNYQLISDPVLLGEYNMDTMSIELGKKSATISVTAEALFADWQRPKVAWYTDAGQQKRHPGDLFFQPMAENAGKEFLWGKP